MQTPPLQVWLGAHTFPQAPQFRTLEVVLTQKPLQLLVPFGQAQLLPLQTRFCAQICPQKPQCCGSLVRSAQEFPHFTSPALHVAAHVPRLHAVPPLQNLLQAPQFCPSSRRLTQRLPHLVSPCGQTQFPAMQLAPAAH